MSTFLHLRIQDKLEYTYGAPYTDPGKRMIFHNQPGPDRPSHSAFDLVLEYQPYNPGADPWYTTTKGMLPVDSGKWNLTEEDEDSVFAGHVAIRDGASMFMVLDYPDPTLEDARPIFDTWPDPPIRKGWRGTGRRTKRTPGKMNFYFTWVCTDVL